MLPRVPSPSLSIALVAAVLFLVGGTTLIPYRLVAPTGTKPQTNFSQYWSASPSSTAASSGDRAAASPAPPVASPFAAKRPGHFVACSGRLIQRPGGCWISAWCSGPIQVSVRSSASGPATPALPRTFIESQFEVADIATIDGRIAIDGRAVGWPVMWLGVFETRGPITLDGSLTSEPARREIMVAWGRLGATVAFHMGVVSAGWGGLVAVRHARRRRVGCCGRCGHRLLPTQSVCPECGSG